MAAVKTVHTKDQRDWIVRRLAAYDAPREVAMLFAIRFPDTNCTEADVLATDPRIAIVDPALHMAFFEERQRVVTDPSSATFADQNARVIVLSKDAEFYGANNQRADRRAVFRQIAEELGIVGGKAGKVGNTSEAGRPITEIVETIIDPKAESDK